MAYNLHESSELCSGNTLAGAVTDTCNSMAPGRHSVLINIQASKTKGDSAEKRVLRPLSACTIRAIGSAREWGRGLAPE
eukprot:5066881-Pyramimonas_sp.AAC.1